MRRKEDPPLIAGKGNYVDDITLPGMLWAAFVRSPEAHAHDHVDRHVRGRRPRRRRGGLHGRRPRPRGAAPARLGAARRGRRRAAALAARQGRGQARRRPGRRRHRRPTATPWSTPPRRSSSSTSRCRSSSTPSGRSRAATLVHRGPRHQQGPRVVARRRRRDARWTSAEVVIERRFVNHRTAGAPIEPRGVHRRLPRRRADDVDRDRRCRTSCGCSSPSSSG